MFRSLYFEDEELKLKCLIKTCILISNKGILEFSFIQADSSSNFIRCHICTCYFHRQEADTKHSKRVALRQNTQKKKNPKVAKSKRNSHGKPGKILSMLFARMH